jgi:hypothetical protein
MRNEKPGSQLSCMFQTAVTLSSVSGKWKADETEETLANISLTIR